MATLKDSFTTSRAYLVGIDKYKFLSKLETACKDVESIATAFLLHEFKPENIHSKLNLNKEEFEKFINQMQSEIEDGDRVVFYFAGHGLRMGDGEQMGGFLIPADGNKNIDSTLLNMTWVLEQFNLLRCRHFLIVLDCCFA